MIGLAALAVTCQLAGAPPLVAPDDRCTPGRSKAGLTRAVACTASLHPRESISSSLRLLVKLRYGINPATFKGEIDHRVPVFLLGRSTLSNLWPESGPIPNAKDRLEFYVYDRVCRERSMSTQTAVGLFTADWRVAWRRYVR